jgi:hypothetical protein
MMPRLSRTVPALLAAALALMGCNGPRVIACPAVAILADAATRPVLKPDSAGTDPAAVQYTVEMTGASQTCRLDTRLGESTSNILLSFRATRAPSGQAARYAVPYFVAVNQGERIITKRPYTAMVDFPAGAAKVVFETNLTNTVLRFENGRLPTDYQYLAGLEVSPAERNYLTLTGRVAP